MDDDFLNELVDFVKRVAGSHYDGDELDPPDDEPCWDIENDDTHTTLFELIDDARVLCEKIGYSAYVKRTLQ